MSGQIFCKYRCDEKSFFGVKFSHLRTILSCATKEDNELTLKVEKHEKLLISITNLSNN